MSSHISFDLKQFLSENPEATKEELITAINTAPEVIGLTEVSIYEYLMEESEDRETPDEDELEELWPDIINYLRRDLVDWENIYETYRTVVLEETGREVPDI